MRRLSPPSSTCGTTNFIGTEGVKVYINKIAAETKSAGISML